jgi:hypothetical protein
MKPDYIMTDWTGWSAVRALTTTASRPRFRDQAGAIVFRKGQPARLLTPICAEFFQLPMCQISLQGVRREFIRATPVCARRLMHRAQQIVRDMQCALIRHVATL